MTHGGDSILASRLDAELEREIAEETDQLIKAPTDIRAGRIQGLMKARAMIGTVYDQINRPRPPGA